MQLNNIVEDKSINSETGVINGEVITTYSCITEGMVNTYYWPVISKFAALSTTRFNNPKTKPLPYFYTVFWKLEWGALSYSSLSIN